MTTKPDSIVSKVLKAFEKYGWDKPTDFISRMVGPIEQMEFSDFDPYRGYRKRWVIKCLSRNRVGAIRLAHRRREAAKIRKLEAAEIRECVAYLFPCPTGRIRDRDDSNPQIELGRILNGVP